jgi:DNA-binding transcriptional regulator LsrR (DeoR family)
VPAHGLAAVIVDVYQRGMRQNEIVAITGYTRESVRRILRAAGVEPG